MSPLLRNVVVALVGFLVAAALVVISLVRYDDPGISVLAMVGAALLAAATGGYLFVQAWRWSVRAYREGATGRSVLIAVAGGVMALVAAASLAGCAILVLLFAGTRG